MRVVLAGTPMIGHLNPLLSIGRLLVANGHDVLGHSAGAHRERFEAAGMRFEPFPPPIDRDLSDLHQAFPELDALPAGPDKLGFLFRNAFIGPLAAQHASLASLLARHPADLVLSDNLFLGVLPFLLGPRAERPAIAFCGVTPLFTSRDDGAPNGPGLPPTADEDTLLDYELIKAFADEDFFGPIQGELDRALEAAGRGPLAMPMNDAGVALPDLYLQPTVAAFEYPRRDSPATLHFIGALPLPAIDMPLPGWADDVAKANRVVLVTQGTLANHDLGEVVAPTLAALADRDDVLVLVTTGGRPLDAIPGPIPGNARLARFLPYDWLMPRLDLVVTNGGYGTVNYALSQGVPVVVAGVNEDKAEVGARVAWSGVGLALQAESPEPEALRHAIDRVLDDKGYRLAARAMATRFSEADSGRRVLRLIEAAHAEHVAAAGPSPPLA